MEQGTVIATTRRYLEIDPSDGDQLRLKLPSGDIEVNVGDEVMFRRENTDVIFESVLQRKNCLKRSYGTRSKELVSNVDLLIAVTAPKPLFNSVFIDRLLTAAHEQSIEGMLLVNKMDLEEEIQDSKDLIEIYEKLERPVCFSSTKTKRGLNDLENVFSDPELRVVVLCGLSGVGKSSLLNRLVPEAAARTQEVSARSGQGKQTTSRAFGYRYQREGSEPLYLVDLPGIQNFGISHLSERQIEDAFEEFRERRHECRFHNCTHIAEPDCAVKAALKEGAIAQSRYDSYLNMLEELEATRPY